MPINYIHPLTHPPHSWAEAINGRYGGVATLELVSADGDAGGGGGGEGGEGEKRVPLRRTWMPDTVTTGAAMTE